MLLTARQSPPPTSADNHLQVVATFSILGDCVQNVGGDRLEVYTLVGPDGDPHTFEPAPPDGAALAEADLVFEIGLGFEPWLDDLYAAAGSSARRLVVTTGLEPLLVSEGDFDPHLWQDVARGMQIVETVREALAQADPENAAAYRSNAAGYLAELGSLDRWVQEQVERLPADRRKLVTSHDTFGYFAERYGFKIVGTAFGSATTEAADPSAAEIAALVEQIRAVGVPAVFVENISNPALMQRSVAETGVALGPPLYTDAVGSPHYRVGILRKDDWAKCSGVHRGHTKLRIGNLRRWSIPDLNNSGILLLPPRAGTLVDRISRRSGPPMANGCTASTAFQARAPRSSTRLRATAGQLVEATPYPYTAPAKARSAANC